MFIYMPDIPSAGVHIGIEASLAGQALAGPIFLIQNLKFIIMKNQNIKIF